jgi:hypothetical protein
VTVDNTNTKSNNITKYINIIRAMSNSTSKEYQKRLRSFNDFIITTYNLSADILIKRQDPNNPEYEKYWTVSKRTSEQIDAYLSEGHSLLKIQRIGSGKETRYNIMPVAA